MYSFLELNELVQVIEIMIVLRKELSCFNIESQEYKTATIIYENLWKKTKYFSRQNYRNV